MPYFEVELTAVDWRREEEARAERGYTSVTDHEDDLERPMEHDFPPLLPAPEIQTFPVSIPLEAIREYYPRRPGRDGSLRTGTRIVFLNGSARPVQETYDEVKAKIAAARGH